MAIVHTGCLERGNSAEPKNPEALSAIGVSIRVFYEGEQQNPASNMVVVEKIRKK